MHIQFLMINQKTTLGNQKSSMVRDKPAAVFHVGQSKRFWLYKYIYIYLSVINGVS